MRGKSVYYRKKNYLIVETTNIYKFNEKKRRIDSRTKVKILSMKNEIMSAEEYEEIKKELGKFYRKN